MAVIINEFEIVPEPPPPTPPPPQREPTPLQSLRLSPENVIVIQQRERKRLERVSAD